MKAKAQGPFAFDPSRQLQWLVDSPERLVQYGELTIAGRLARISGQTREQSGGVDSFIRFDKPPLGLRLGSTVRVYLELPAEPDVIVVPAEALYGRNQLYKLVDNRMQMVEVERTATFGHTDEEQVVWAHSAEDFEAFGYRRLDPGLPEDAPNSLRIG